MENKFIKESILLEFKKLENKEKKDLIKFHSNNKYLYFVYNIKLKDSLGQVLSEKKDYKQIYKNYEKLLLEIFEKQISVGRLVNAYEHMYGYFKNLLDENEIKEYNKLIKIPINENMMNKYFIKISTKYNVKYIMQQKLIKI